MSIDNTPPRMAPKYRGFPIIGMPVQTWRRVWAERLLEQFLEARGLTAEYEAYQDVTFKRQQAEEETL